jgi:hypothetical protein
MAASWKKYSHFEQGSSIRGDYFTDKTEKFLFELKEGSETQVQSFKGFCGQNEDGEFHMKLCVQTLSKASQLMTLLAENNRQGLFQCTKCGEV